MFIYSASQNLGNASRTMENRTTSENRINESKELHSEYWM